MTLTDILLGGQCLGQIVVFLVVCAVFSELRKAKQKDGGNGRYRN